MKERALEIHTTPEVVVPDAPAEAARGRAGDYVELTKPRITLLILLTSAAGFCLGSSAGVDYLALAHATVGIGLLSSGVSTLNQFMERDLDRLMRRTRARPLPAGRLDARHALLFGAALTVGAEVYLAAFVNLLTAALGLVVIAGYVFCYTPLKTRTSLSTVVGAVPGAMPPLMGWTAAAGSANLEAWALFAILFAWQFPHFLAIAWMYREDYARAGIVMLPVVEPDGRRTAQQIVVWTLLLVPVSVFPTMLGTSGRLYLFGALALGLALIASSMSAASMASRHGARRLLLASVLYLPLLFGLMVVNNYWRF
ncbi:MAG TPA: heme o synthase [Pyrinomonadaceae bacterium]|nr:heme o synthase [Pyrinomonadaceae bacterium]